MIKSRNLKKVSINLSEETLEKIDELAEILNLTRTLAIEVLVTAGLPKYIAIVESANKKLQSDMKHKTNKKLKIMLDKLQNFKEKWNI